MVPPTVVGDASGALGLAFGMVCALLAARQSGQGRVVDSAIVDVVAMLGGIAQMVHANGQLGGPGPSPFHDSPFYDVYACADGAYITLGALEPQFYKLALEKLGLTDVDATSQYDTQTWPALKARMAALFASQSRAYWCTHLERTDVCFAPVLSLQEAAEHPHNMARGTYQRTDGHALRVAAAPRFLPLQ
jgi:alpha-methylacyl-CoA racemase